MSRIVFAACTLALLLSSRSPAQNAEPVYCYDAPGRGTFALEGTAGHAMYCLGVSEANSAFISEDLEDGQERTIGGMKWWRYRESSGSNWYWYFSVEPIGGEGFVIQLWTPGSGLVRWSDNVRRCAHSEESAEELRRQWSEEIGQLDGERPEPEATARTRAEGGARFGYDGFGPPHYGTFRLEGQGGRARYCVFGVCFDNELTFVQETSVPGVGSGWAYVEDYPAPWEFFFPRTGAGHTGFAIFYRTTPGVGAWVKWSEKARRCRLAPATGKGTLKAELLAATVGHTDGHADLQPAIGGVGGDEERAELSLATNEVTRYYARWDTNDSTRGLIFMQNASGPVGSISTNDPSEFRLLLDMLRYEKPVHYDSTQRRLNTQFDEPVGEQEGR